MNCCWLLLIGQSCRKKRNGRKKRETGGNKGRNMKADCEGEEKKERKEKKRETKGILTP